MLESDEGNSTTVYHRFDQSTLRFDTPSVTVAKGSENSPAVSQDGFGGVFATYLLGGPGGPIELSYSANGGKSFTSGALNANKAGGADKVISSVNAGGQGWASWIDNGSVFAQSFQASDAIEPASVGGGDTTNGQTMTLNVNCASFPCTITITLTAPETVVVHAAAAGTTASKHKTKTITLGKGKFTLKSKGRKLSVKLSKTGRHFISSRHGHVKVTALITNLVGKHSKSKTRTVNVRIVSHKK